mmetsp:Transcript_44464/g.32572  ORF Transcript_44464/g.32572 Transcript_44464/m.32572 type:complete len:91 (+) Transcript_44464:216-488(+)
MKVNQAFSLVNVDWSISTSNHKAHFDQILEQMRLKDGLDYLPRERSIEGRVFEHASDCRLLTKVIIQSKLEDTKEQAPSDPILTINMEEA